MGVVAKAWGDMAVIAFGFALVVIWVHPLAKNKKRKAKRAAQVAEAERFLAQGAIQSALDDAYALAEEQAPAQAETGQGGAMPSREVVAACASAGEHDRLPISEHDRALEVALLESKFRHEERPQSATTTDPGVFDAW